MPQQPLVFLVFHQNSTALSKARLSQNHMKSSLSQVKCVCVQGSQSRVASLFVKMYLEDF